MTFSERWEQIVELLQAKSTQFGVPSENVAPGDFINNKDFVAPPAVLVYLDVGDLLTLTQSAEDCTCTILFFWLVTESVPRAIGEAVDNAKTLWSQITKSSLPIRKDGPPIRIAAVQSEVVVVSVQFITTAR